MSTILVLIDHETGATKKISKQILTVARGLGDEVHAAMFGPGASNGAEVLGAFGASTVYVWNDEAVTAYATEPQVRALEAALDASGAEVLLFPSDPFVTDVAARTAIRRGAGIITDAVDLVRDGDTLVATKAIFGGDMVSRCAVRPGFPRFFGIKANAFTAEESGGQPAQVVELDVALDDAARRAEIVEVVEQASGDRPEMTEASIIAAGGRGLGEAEGFRLIEQLADALGGAVGASRAATDAGWYPHQHQIGQTGKTVAPQLYIGAGISGAIQHRAGMQTSQLIAAINKDADAPIFSIADFGVVGDLHKVIPSLIEEINKRKA
ncbi:MAG TPA: electron transfer flavoprotein subunit alpha/FixB family protein [Euzebyales bacterium]|nr:electron transfer flavoprotein subunit alpha/FixB family protein [Euzebyales bacterium]